MNNDDRITVLEQEIKILRADVDNLLAAIARQAQSIRYPETARGIIGYLYDIEHGVENTQQEDDPNEQT